MSVEREPPKKFALKSITLIAGKPPISGILPDNKFRLIITSSKDAILRSDKGRAPDRIFDAMSMDVNFSISAKISGIGPVKAFPLAWNFESEGSSPISDGKGPARSFRDKTMDTNLDASTISFGREPVNALSAALIEANRDYRSVSEKKGRGEFKPKHAIFVPNSGSVVSSLGMGPLKALFAMTTV